MATIGEVAQRAGVSRSTVSYALSGNRSISADTRQRIDAAIRDLNYTPNAGARALATSRTMVIGLFLHFYEDEFSPAMMQYVMPVADAAREAGYDILMVTDQDGPGALARVARSDMVDGVMLLNVAHDEPRLKVLDAIRQPAAMVGMPGEASKGDVFDLDFAEAGRMLVEHLAEKGHRRVTLVAPHREVYERGGAYAWRFRDAALQRADELGLRSSVHYGETQQPAVDRQLREIVREAAGGALLVHNDAAIAALPSVLHREGLEVPRDLAVAGVFSEDFGRLFSLPYTAIETSPATLGAHAVRALVGRMNGPLDGPQARLELVQPHVIDRGSTG